jgi:hypothetical protein
MCSSFYVALLLILAALTVQGRHWKYCSCIYVDAYRRHET